MLKIPTLAEQDETLRRTQVRNEHKRNVDCPAWEDGVHCFVPCDLQVDPDDAMVIRARAKACACGARVNRGEGTRG